MSSYDLGTTVGQMVAERPARARIFEKLGIDYCCGGKLALGEACRRKGLDGGTVLQMLQASEAPSETASEVDWTRATMTELCNHIVETHHAYLKTELPRLMEMTTKVANVHGDRHPELREVRFVFATLKAELDSHLMKEEQILFPAIREMEAGSADARWHCGGIDRPISVMEHEHDSAGQALARLRELTGDYVPPADACNTFRATLDGLAQLEADLHEHIHKENNILFPRAMEKSGLAVSER